MGMGEKPSITWVRLGSRLRRDDQGVVAIVVALSLTALVGLIGLGVEVAGWYVSKRQLQAAADSAAIAAASENAKGNAAGVTGAAFFEAQRQGFQGANCAYMVAGSDCTVYSPPTTGNYTTDYTAFEVVLTEPLNLAFTRIFTDQAPSIAARAVAHAETTGEPTEACVLGLNDEPGEWGVYISGTPSLTLDGCSLRSNNNMTVAGAATVTAEATFAGGTISGQANITTTPEANNHNENAGSLGDPYADQMASEFAKVSVGGGGTNYTQGGPPSGTFTLSSGTYGSIAISRTTYLCGTYYVNGNVTITSASGKALMASGCSSGVSIVAAGYIRADGQATINLTAPTSGATSGIVFASEDVELLDGSEAATENVRNYVQGGANVTVNGALYFPYASLRFAGNSESGGGCTQVIAWTVRVSGTSSLGNNCEDAGTTPMVDEGDSIIKIKLVE